MWDCKSTVFNELHYRKVGGYFMTNQNSATDKYWHLETALSELSGTGVPRAEELSPGLEKEIPPERQNITNSFRKDIKQTEMAVICSAVTAAELALGCLNTLSRDKHQQELEKLEEVAKKRSECEAASILGKRQYLKNGAIKIY